MVRVLGGPGDPATRLENRIGEPAANPYLYMASQVLAGLDGIDAPPRSRPVGRCALRDQGRAAAEDAWPRRWPRCASDAFFRERLGADFVDYFLTIKDAEIARFQAEVTDWEQREYFEMF